MTAGTTDPVAEVAGREYRLLIGGEQVGAASGAVYETVDPSTGRVLTTVPQASAKDVDRAVDAAAAAQPGWAALGLEGRRPYLAQIAEIVAEHAEALALADAVDCGNPYRAALHDVLSTVDRCRQWPALALAVQGNTVPATIGNLHYTVHEPYGVVGRIIPFNHPALFAIGKVLPALTMGNTVVLKPAEQTPLSALAFGELVRDILPSGVINVVTGGAETGEAVVRNPVVKRIAFTGSVATARRIQAIAAESGIKHLSFELGGKNALIAFPDASLEDVVAAAVDGMNFALSQGQSCGSTSRLFIHDALYEDFLELAAERVQALRIGRAYDDDVDMGPLVARPHYERVSGYVESGLREGARLVTGGKRPHGLDEGFFLEPTVFADVSMKMRIAREEIFGPVMSVLRWSDLDTVIRQANDVDLGLTASIWTNDLHLALKTAQALRVGYVWINDVRHHYWGTPFGGYKNSGLGREESIDELLGYCEVKSVHAILRAPELAFVAVRDREARRQGAT